MYFLATTALERFWDKPKKILFLHEGCCRFSKRTNINELDYIIMPGVWSDDASVKYAIDQVDRTYEKVIINMVDILNKMHNRQLSERYWRIIIGRWLHNYIFSVYDRYFSIKKALKMDPDLESIVLDDSCFIVPQKVSDLYTYLQEDFYNLQLYSQILNFLGKKFPTKKMVYQVEEQNEKDSDIGNDNKVRTKTNALIMNKSYFSNVTEMMLVNKCNFPIETYFEGEMDLPFFKIDWKFRDNIHFDISAENEFEHFILNSIKVNIPAAYVEGYSFIENISYTHPIYSRQPKAILSAVSYDSDEVFKQWAASCAEQGTKLIGVAHSIAYPYPYEYETHLQTVCDRFYKPNFIFSSDEKKSKLAPASRFTGRREYDAAANTDECTDILFVSTCLSRYLCYAFRWLIDFSNEKYYDNQKKFWESLSNELKNYFKVRLYIRDYGNDCINRWNEFDKNIILEKWELPLIERMANCKIVIFDNFQTTFTEAMVLNKPAILYWNYQKYTDFFHPDAVACFDKLRSVGILHDSPYSAAKLLNEVYSDIDNWWNNSERQDARKLLCDVFTGNSANAIEKWVTEINDFLEEDMQPAASLTDYFNKMPGQRIAYLGVNEVTNYMVNFAKQFETKQIVGVIDNDEANFGKYLSGIEVNSLTEIMSRKPDTIIICILPYAKQIENQLKECISGWVKIINIARDFPEEVFRELIVNIYGDSVRYL